MVHWGKHPEFAPTVKPWRKKLDVFIVVAGLAITAYNAAYVGLGLYYGEIDHEKEKQDLRKLDDRINKVIYGRSMSEMPALFKKVHENLSLVEMAAKIREQQDKQSPSTALTNNTSNNNDNNSLEKLQPSEDVA